MSLTAFNRLRRMKQEEAMKPETIAQVEEKVEEPVQAAVEEKVEAPVQEATAEETKTSARRGRRSAN